MWTDGRTDGRTDRYDEAFRNFADAPKNYPKVHNINFFPPPANAGCLAVSFAQSSISTKCTRALQVLHREAGLNSAQSYKSLKNTGTLV